MTLMGIVGELGAGKTLALTYFGWRNWYFKQKQIFSNYRFYGFPYIPIKTIRELDNMKSGFFAGDELWLSIDARSSLTTKNRVTGGILLRSRKRDLNFCFTSQSIDQIDKRIRKVCDFTVYPIMNRNETVCKVIVFRGGNPQASSILQTMYFWTLPVFAMYDHRQEVEPFEDDSKEETEIVFKEITVPIDDNPRVDELEKNFGFKRKDLEFLKSKIR